MSVNWELMCATLPIIGKEQPPGRAEMFANTMVTMTIGKIVECRKYEKLTERLEAEATPAKALLADTINARRAEAYAKTSWSGKSSSEKHFANK
jgi:hypothetical protein